MRRRGRGQAKIPLEKVRKYTWRIPKSYKAGMRVPGIVLADDLLLEKMLSDRTLEQCANVAHIPGIYKYSLTLPDGHEGYGFPIGGVAITDFYEGALSPGGVGYDINCGVRLLITNLDEKDIRQRLPELTETIFHNVPCGLGSRRKDFRLTRSELNKLMVGGAQWIINKGMGWEEDSKHCEEKGAMEGADPNKVSDSAKNRGLSQIGTLGSGNHFLEIGKVNSIYDAKTAKEFGIHSIGQVTVMIHCGSRGFGHQICSDYLRVMERAVHKYKIEIPDRELACAPGNSREAEDYFSAMACAVNYAFANRQAITYWVRQSFESVYKEPAEKFGLQLTYDVAHNLAKIEEHNVDGEVKKVWTHRKGATRAFPPGSDLIPADYRNVGQPVLIPGSMGTFSWVLVGNQSAIDVSFGSTAHGAGRMLSRSAAKRRFWGEDVKSSLEKAGIVVRAASNVVLAEEADPAYKDVNRVVEVSHQLGIATKVAQLKPIAIIKG